MHAPRTILLTSFGSFPSAPFNPSQAVAVLAMRHVEGRLQRLGIRLVHETLPVVFKLTAPTLHALRQQHRPQAILHLGLAGRRKVVTPEAWAHNKLTTRYPDASGQRSTSSTVTPGGPAVLPASLPAVRLAQVLRASGVPAEVSRDAGSYVCNQTLYLNLLSARAPHAPPCKAGFIHLPRPGIAGRPTLRAMGRGIAACLMATAKGL